MKSRIRPRILEEYGQPREVPCVHTREPAFFAGIKDMTPEEGVHADGPFWVSWPSDEPFPEEYAKLEQIVRRSPGK
jgi:hypothetical protein